MLSPSHRTEPDLEDLLEQIRIILGEQHQRSASWHIIGDRPVGDAIGEDEPELNVAMNDFVL